MKAALSTTIIQHPKKYCHARNVCSLYVDMVIFERGLIFTILNVVQQGIPYAGSICIYEDKKTTSRFTLL